MITCPYCDRTYDAAACGIPTTENDAGRRATVVCKCGQRFDVFVVVERTWATAFLGRKVRLVSKR